MDTQGKFLIGKNIADDSRVLYDPGDLTTHGVVVGMTGSGKTGLCIDLLEEAALNRYPAVMIDPKGDITNALLHFPDLLPADFEPWVNADEARREGKSPAKAAEETANLWKNGLAKWGIGKERIAQLNQNVRFTIFTPGSEAGVPVNILSSLKVPDQEMVSDSEIIREKISGTVIAILGLVGMTDIDPVQSKEHILLSNIFETAWSAGKDLNLSELILQTQNPPFDKLGVFDLDSFFPQKERDALAFRLNNILAAPSFKSWISGVPLDVQTMLWDETGKPRHSIFYIAHLSDEERMFFVTLLYSAIESWMRSQKGTTTLRALVYFDEIFGYLPPIANPPSKEVMLRMLKQGRAFGVSQVLVTQNPVDLDYKGLSNTGTWFIGKLQTERDKERLIEGLLGVSSGRIDRNTFDQLITGLEKRQFLLHNVHEKEPIVFYTRWAMNYLAGPMTRNQIPALNALVGVTADGSLSKEFGATAAEPADSMEADKAEAIGYASRQEPPGDNPEFFMPVTWSLSAAITKSGRDIPVSAESQGVIYRPGLLSSVVVSYLQQKYNLDTQRMVACIVQDADNRGLVRWDKYLIDPALMENLERDPQPESRFLPLEPPLNDKSSLSSLEKDFVDWVYQTQRLEIFHHEPTDTYSSPGVSKEDFLDDLEDTIEDALDDEVEEIKAKYESKIKSIQKKITSEQRELDQDEAELKQRKMEELATHAENILGFISGSRSKRRVSTSMTKRRMTSRAKSDVEESLEMIEDLQKELTELAEEMNEEIEELENNWADQDENVKVIPISPYKKNIHPDRYGIVWIPYYLLRDGEDVLEVLACELG
jgi:phage host-nuclease inhibitor protein Gam